MQTKTQKPASDQCQLYAGCTNPAAHNVHKKAFMAKQASDLLACSHCAGTIGQRSPDGPLINQPGRESRFYKITDLQTVGP